MARDVGLQTVDNLQGVPKFQYKGRLFTSDAFKFGKSGKRDSRFVMWVDPSSQEIRYGMAMVNVLASPDDPIYVIARPLYMGNAFAIPSAEHRQTCVVGHFRVRSVNTVVAFPMTSLIAPLIVLSFGREYNHLHKQVIVTPFVSLPSFEGLLVERNDRHLADQT